MFPVARNAIAPPAPSAHRPRSPIARRLAFFVRTTREGGGSTPNAVSERTSSGFDDPGTWSTVFCRAPAPGIDSVSSVTAAFRPCVRGVNG